MRAARATVAHEAAVARARLLDDGADRCRIRIRDLLVGTTGLLNGVGGSCPGGTATTDPHHGEDADYHFHPTRVAPMSDDEVRMAIRTFAHALAT